MSTSSDNKKLILKSSDKESFEVEEIVASESAFIKRLIEDSPTDSAFPFPNITGKILSKVLEYCKKHVYASKSADPYAFAELEVFDAEFVDVDQPTLFGLIMAANYLDIKGLLDLTCQAAANKIKDKSPEEIRVMFNIENDFTREEEDEIRKEHQWAFE